MTPGDEERLRSWVFEIVEALIENVAWRQEGDERRVVGRGGLSVNARTGAWYSHSLARGSWSAIPLIELLRSCDRHEAVAWAEAWLQSHPGLGSVGDAGEDDDDNSGSGSAAFARELLARAVDPVGTPAEDYLRRSRGITGKLPPCVRYVADARVGEGALASLLTAHARIVGVQLTCLDAFAKKSTVVPFRRTFMVERAPGACFEIQPAPPGIADMFFDTVICEGLEDGLSVAELGRPVRILAVPGIGALGHISVKRNERVLVAADGDDPDSPAGKALVAGIDHLLVQGAFVRVTETEAGVDANAVLQRGGIAELARWLADNSPAELSRDGEITRLSLLAPLDYDGERKAAAELLGLRLSTLDAEIARLRGAKSAANQADSSDDVDTIELLDDPPELRETLDEILAELARYIVADEAPLATVALWAAHTHLCHHERIRLQRSPRLAIQARTPGSGKTSLLECVGALVPRPRVAASLTASTVLRVVDLVHPCLLIDEADRVLRDRNSDLLANSGDRRGSSWVERSTPTADGGWQVQRFSVWGAVAFAGINELPETQQDRSIVIQMEKALGSDIKEHLEDGSSPELTMLKRRLATWAHNLEELPRPVMPDLLTRQAGRVGDNWRCLFSIAQLAGGRWPVLVETAALAAVRREGQMTSIQRLLESMWRIFEKRGADARIKKGDDKTRIPTQDLISALLADDQEEWGTVNRGRAVTDYWLRDNLRHLLDPPRTQEWEDPMRGQQRRRYRGYYKSQFEKAWQRHLPSSFFLASEPSTGSAGPVEDEEYQTDTSGKAAPGTGGMRGNGAAPDDPTTADHAEHSSAQTAENSMKSNTTADPADPADSLDGKAKEEEEGAEPIDIDQDIIAFAQANPKKSVASIARKFGQPPAIIRQLLGRTK